MAHRRDHRRRIHDPCLNGQHGIRRRSNGIGNYGMSSSGAIARHKRKPTPAKNWRNSKNDGTNADSATIIHDTATTTASILTQTTFSTPKKNQQYQGYFGRHSNGYWNDNTSTYTEGYRGGRGGGRVNKNSWRGGRLNRRKPKKVTYCWTHGLCGHTVKECTNRMDGHKEEANLENKMSGIMKNCGQSWRCRIVHGHQSRCDKLNNTFIKNSTCTTIPPHSNTQTKLKQNVIAKADTCATRHYFTTKDANN